MSDIEKTLESYPDINFIDNLTLEELKSQMISDYCEMYKELTGDTLELAEADPNRLILYASCLQIYQSMQYINDAAKQNFLKYARGNYLDNLGAQKGVYRKQGDAATTIIRFSVSQTYQNAITIPKGTRVTAGDNVYFYTSKDDEIPSGQEYVDIPAKCVEYGSRFNGYGIGKINKLVEQIAYIGSVSNLYETAGGTDAETDSDLKSRIYLAPSSYSTAGPEDAYKYWIKMCNSDIEDIAVMTTSDAVVQIVFILQNGELPSEVLLETVSDYLEENNVRPLTDKVELKAPTVVNYNIKFKYWISESDAKQATAIQDKVLEAVETYKIWQSNKIGRDINPSYLTKLLMNVGAKRVEIESPSFSKLPSLSVGICTDTKINYGGVEDD